MRNAALVLTLLFAPATATADEPKKSAPAESGTGVVSGWQRDAMDTVSFLNSHPDIMYTMEGRAHYLKRDYVRAARSFERAAYFGDKMAQAILAEMYWNGEGVNIDRVKAYSFLDMAAERMNNEVLLARRETLWAQLSHDEQQRVIKGADAFVARYSDRAVRPRLQQRMRQGRQSGRAKNYGKFLNSIKALTWDGRMVEIKPDAYHDDRFWDVDKYTALKDELTEQVMRTGKVTVKFAGKDGGASDHNAEPVQTDPLTPTPETPKP